MSNHNGVSKKSRAIFQMIAQGWSCAQIVDSDPSISYLDVFSAAGEVLTFADRIEKPSSEYDDRIAAIRERYPKAYEPWSREDEELLLSLQREGVGLEEIAQRLQRQPSAIQSRLRRLGIPPESMELATHLEQLKARLAVAERERDEAQEKLERWYYENQQPFEQAQYEAERENDGLRDTLDALRGLAAYFQDLATNQEEELRRWRNEVVTLRNAARYRENAESANDDIDASIADVLMQRIRELEVGLREIADDNPPRDLWALRQVARSLLEEQIP